MLKKCALFALAALCAQPALAKDHALSGLRIEVRGGYETPTISDDTVYKLGNSASIGAEAGYDVPLGKNVTFGPYVNYDYANAETCSGGFCLGSDGNLAAGGRIGINVGERTQIYGKIGYDGFRLKASIPGASETETLDGVGGALGVDFNFSSRFYVGFEAEYADLGSFAGVNFQRRHVAVTLGTRF